MTAGSTFVGQFIDHDITFDQTSQLGVPQNPLTSPNTRTPALDLDSVFGGGPGMRPDLYVSNADGSVGPKLKGPLVLAFSKDDPGAAARVIKDFAKANEKLVATLVSLGGQVLPGKDLERVASLPTREQALAMLMGVMKAPIQKLVATLAEPPAKLARTLAAVRDQKQQGGA